MGQAQFDGRFQVVPGEAHVIEASHVVANNSEIPRWTYYEYRSGDGLSASTSDNVGIIARGDFQVYFWGQTVEYSDGQQQGQFVTGFEQRAAQGDLGRLYFVKEDHFRYAVLSVVDGELSYSQSSGPVHLFASEMDATSGGSITYRGATGVLPIEGGEYQVQDGTIRVAGGQYLWSLSGGDVGVQVLKVPRAATSTNAIFVRAPQAADPPAWSFLALAGTAVLLAAVLYLYPSLRGLSAAPTGNGWRSRRADGYATMASSAEARGWHRLAAAWMAWSLRVVPADPMRIVDLAILRAAYGDHDEALRLHEMAHGWLVDAARSDHVAHNAYQAAKSAARLGRSAHALDWMRMAIEVDPGLLTNAVREPAFALLRDDPDYASLTVGGA